MKRGILAVLLVVSLGVNIGFLVHWFWPKNKTVPARLAPSDRSGWHASSIRRDLDLNPGQVRQMENERRRVMDQVRPLQDELRSKRRELLRLLKQSSLPEAELDAALAEIARLQAAVEKMFVLHSHHVRGFFTPEQLGKYEAFFENGLCPGMLHAENCAPQKAAGAPSPAPDCGLPCAQKK
jgi:Spy/CpxP family protein refolding chaperone